MSHATPRRAWAALVEYAVWRRPGSASLPTARIVSHLSCEHPHSGGGFECCVVSVALSALSVLRCQCRLDFDCERLSVVVQLYGMGWWLHSCVAGACALRTGGASFEKGSSEHNSGLTLSVCLHGLEVWSTTLPLDLSVLCTLYSDSVCTLTSVE